MLYHLHVCGSRVVLPARFWSLLVLAYLVHLFYQRFSHRLTQNLNQISCRLNQSNPRWNRDGGSRSVSHWSTIVIRAVRYDPHVQIHSLERYDIGPTIIPKHTHYSCVDIYVHFIKRRPTSALKLILDDGAGVKQRSQIFKKYNLLHWNLDMSVHFAESSLSD
jgi:hypothetical protein